MSDPLSQVITLLQPRAVFSRLISGRPRGAAIAGEPSFCAVLEGSCRLAVDGHPPATLKAGDFVLLPATPGFTMSGFEPVSLERFDPKVTAKMLGEVRHGTRGGRPDVRLLGGGIIFGSPDTALLVSLLRSLVHVRGVERLSVLVRLVGEEASERRAGRDLVLTGLVEVLLVEALRAAPGEDTLQDCCAGWPMRISRQRFVKCMAISRARGRSSSSRRRPRFRARRSLNGSHAASACRRWNTCWPGEWRSRRVCSTEKASGWPRWRNAQATAQRYLQHRLQPPRRPASESLRRERASDSPTAAMNSLLHSIREQSNTDAWIEALSRGQILRGFREPLSPDRGFPGGGLRRLATRHRDRPPDASRPNRGGAVHSWLRCVPSEIHRQLLVVDAEQILERFIIDGMPDRARFETAVIPLIEKSVLDRDKCVIRAYGEMVDVLWQSGQMTAAIKLEMLWNELAQTHDFSLLCGYAMGNFYKDTVIGDICQHHTHVLSDMQDIAPVQ